MKLFLANGIELDGISFGADMENAGEVVFTTGMTGYLETLTDPSYYGQIICFTYPLIGNYGVFEKEMTRWLEKSDAEVDEVYESAKIWVKGVIVAEPSEEFSHALGKSKFSDWLKSQNIPALTGIDTRALTQELREHGTILGAIAKNKPSKFEDLLNGRFVPEVSPKNVEILLPSALGRGVGGEGFTKTIAFIDCGAKNGIFRNFLKRGVRVIRVPFDQNPFELDEKFDGIFFSNGPGDPEVMTETIEIAKIAMEKDIPMFGICLGCQIFALAAGGKTLKMKYGHRSVNQPVQDVKTNRCIITTQNHGFMVDTETLPSDYEVWFKNLNDDTVEGIRHKTKPISATQFHPEACGGPEDGEYLFDEFIKQL